MTGDPPEPRCDWLQQARIEISSNAIIFHDEIFVKMVAIEEIINRLSEERQRCYKAHSDAEETNQHEPSLNKCHTCRTLQWDNRLIWSLESLLAWVRANHMDQHDIRDHIDLMLGEYRNELESRQSEEIPDFTKCLKIALKEEDIKLVDFFRVCYAKESCGILKFSSELKKHDAEIRRDERKKILGDISKWRKEVEAKGNEGDISACAAWLEEDVFLLSLRNPTSLKSETAGDSK